MSSRGDSDFLLDRDVDKVRAVSPARAKNLAKMGIRTVRDLLGNYPRRYVDLSNVETATRAPIGQFVTVTGTVDEVVVLVGGGFGVGCGVGVCGVGC